MVCAGSIPATLLTKVSHPRVHFLHMENSNFKWTDKAVIAFLRVYTACTTSKDLTCDVDYRKDYKGKTIEEKVAQFKHDWVHKQHPNPVGDFFSSCESLLAEREYRTLDDDQILDVIAAEIRILKSNLNG